MLASWDDDLMKSVCAIEPDALPSSAGAIVAGGMIAGS
jgi:hypothetical protein